VPSTYLRELCRAAGLPPPGEGGRAARAAPAGRAPALAGGPSCSRRARACPASPPLEGGVAAGRRARRGPRARRGAQRAGAAPGGHDGLVRPPAGGARRLEEVLGSSPKGLRPLRGVPVPTSFASRRPRPSASARRASERGRGWNGAARPAASSITPLLEALSTPGLARGRLGGEEGLGPRVRRRPPPRSFAENDWRAPRRVPAAVGGRAPRDVRAPARLHRVGPSRGCGAAAYRPRLYEKRLQGEPAGRGARAACRGRASAEPRRRRDGGAKVVPRRRLQDEAGARHLKGAREARAAARRGPSASLLRRARGRGRWARAGSFGTAPSCSSSRPREGRGTARRRSRPAELEGRARESFLKLVAGRVEAIASGRFPDPAGGGGATGTGSRCEFTARSAARRTRRSRRPGR